ncbi:hypothetical protein BDBG_03389 [Blastomyces gilchristii SLH14081]|uniref:Uncharacterized protein n=1 Tax=Blastomyces gilchristii (strain SLH14081) TaxID=559298 RepID=A0A179UJB7_BLAGS|nr:uncharacterized protein BDBG_03389 [Blastomyces gilchristii SLH14081]OAT07318.1 hypothetical protein BDBG_03389 [Blastomyces gilchristii SLH14081]
MALVFAAGIWTGLRVQRRASQDHEEEYQGVHGGLFSSSSFSLIMESFYDELLQTRQDIEKSIAKLREPLQHLEDSKASDDIRKYLQDFSAAFCELSSLFEKVASFTSLAVRIAEDCELKEWTWHTTAFWEDYGHIQQIKLTYSLCNASEGDQLRRGLEHLQIQMRGLHAVCEENKEQLEEDLK